MRLWRRLLMAGIVLLSSSGGAVAQVDIPPSGYRVAEPAVVLEELASGRDVTMTILAAFRGDRPETEDILEGNYHLYTDAQRQELLDGLERIGTAEEAPSGRTRASTAFIFTMIYYHPDVEAPPEAAELPGRLVRIYDTADALLWKAKALHVMAYFIAHGPPSETPEMLERMFEAAAGPGPPTHVPAGTAVDALLESCRPAIPFLRRLANERRVREYREAVHVRRIVEGGVLNAMEARRGGRPCPNPAGP